MLEPEEGRGSEWMRSCEAKLRRGRRGDCLGGAGRLIYIAAGELVIRIW